MTADQQLVVGGVDTHKDEHVAVALTTTGRRLGAAAFPATTDGYVALRTWLAGFGDVLAVGVEGCGSYGLGLFREFTAAGVKVHEVCRPNRQLRRRRGKSDAVDAEAAARTALAGEDLITPKSADGPVETMRALRLARRSAIKARDTATNQLHALIVTAPNELRERLGGQPIARVVQSLLDDDLGGAVKRLRDGDAQPRSPLAAARRRSGRAPSDARGGRR